MSLLCVTLLFGTAKAELPRIWLGATAPMTGGGWDAGLAVKAGGDLMLEEVNKNSLLLPDYNLSIVWQNDRCEPDHARNLFLRNLFQEEYEAFAPGTAVSDLDVNGDGVITTSETQPLSEVWNRTQVDPLPVGFLGQGCSAGTGPVIPIASAARAPFVSPTATFPGLSDRVKYPNFFRTQIPDSYSYFALLEMAKLLGHTKVAALTNTGAFIVAAEYLAAFADAIGVQLVGRDLNDEIPGFHGYLVTSEATAPISEIIEELMQLRVRIVMVMQYLAIVRPIFCESMKHGYTTAAFLVMGWLEFGWWRKAYMDCSAEVMMQSVKGLLLAKMVYWRLDSSTPLTCAPNIDAQTFFERYFISQGAEPGQLKTVDAGYTLYDDGSSTADAVCMYALALHELLYVRNFTLSELVARTSRVYNAWQEVFASTNFQGVSGHMTFLPGQSDPVASVIVQQVHSDDTVKDIATYRGSGQAAGDFNWLGRANLTFKFPGETVLADGTPLTLRAYRHCGGEETLNFSTNECQNCSVNTLFMPLSKKCLCVGGYYSSDGTGEAPCLPCGPGNHSTILGSTSCNRCPLGKHAEISGSTECTFCSKGRYSNRQGAMSCTQCPPLQTTEFRGSEDPSACICSHFAYSLPDSSGCAECPANSTSRAADDMTAAVNVTSCRCATNTYMSPQYDQCLPCPQGSRTKDSTSAYPGHTSIKSCLCGKGTYMNEDNLCADCPAHMECPEGSNVANGNEENLLKPEEQRTDEETFMRLQAGYWSSAQAPLEIFKCGNEKRCPGRSPGHACADNLRDLACAHCADNYKWDGDRCIECVAFQSNVFVFPLFPILLIFVVICMLYKFFGDPFPKWGSWQNSTAALLFVLLNFYQVLGIMGAQSPNLPQILRDVMDRFNAVNSISLGFGLACVNLGELVNSMVAKAVAPAIVVAATVITYYTSKILAKTTKMEMLMMDQNRLANVLGSIMFTFFSAISSMSLALFRCQDNPSGKSTLAVDLGVLCWTSKTWLAALGIGVICVLLYIIGMGGVFLWVIFVAPTHFENRDFQMRWKFLFIKFHAGAYWWGIMFLGKNFLINVVPVAVTSDVGRLYISMTVIMIYLGVVAAKLPYRATVVNVFEIGFCVGTIYASSLLTWYLDRNDEFEQKNDHIGMGTLILTLTPLGVTPMGMMYLALKGRGANPSATQMQSAEGDFNSLRGSFSVFSKLDSETAARIMLHMCEGDRRTLKAADFLIRTDVMGVESVKRVSSRTSEVKRLTQRLTTQEMPENMSPRMLSDLGSPRGTTPPSEADATTARITTTKADTGAKAPPVLVHV